MLEARKLDFDQANSILGEEDEATLAAIDLGIKAGRVLSAEEVNRRIEQWLSESSTPKSP